MDYNKEMVENKNDQNPKDKQQLIEIGEASTIWTFKSPVESEDSQYIEKSVREDGRSRFGWSNKDHHNLTRYVNKDRADNENLGVTAFLLKIKKGDWIVHINCPSHGKCLAVKVLSGYKWDDKSTYGDFRHYFEIDKDNVIAFDRNDSLILETVHLSLIGKQWKIKAKEDFVKSMNSVIKRNLEQSQKTSGKSDAAFIQKAKYGENKEEVTSVLIFMNALRPYTEGLNPLTNNFLYKGLTNSDWEIKSTDQMRLGSKAKKNIYEMFSNSDPITYQQLYNQTLIQYFKHEFSDGYKGSYLLDSDLAVLAQLRHYNAANALTDFSGNPLVALWFACQPHKEEIPVPRSEDEKLAGYDLYRKEETNATVHILDINNQKNFIEINSNEQLKRYSMEEIFNKENSDNWFYWKPSHLNKRIPAQSSYFVIGHRIPPTDPIIILNKYKEQILEELDQVYNINTLTMFPDMHGFASANSHDSPYKESAEYRMIIRFYNSEIEIANHNKDQDKVDALEWQRGLTRLEFNLMNEAIDDFTRLIAREVDFVEHVYFSRGAAYNKLDENEEALNDLNFSIRKGRAGHHIYYVRGVIYTRLAQYEEAIADFNKALEIGTMNKETQETLDEIKKGLLEAEKLWEEQKNKNKKKK